MPSELPGSTKPAGWIYVIASPDNATQRYLYRSKTRRIRHSRERVTPANRPGSHSYDIAPRGRMAFHTYSHFDRPPSTDVVDLRDACIAASADGRRPLWSRSSPPSSSPPVEFFKIDVERMRSRSTAGC